VVTTNVAQRNVVISLGSVACGTPLAVTRTLRLDIVKAYVQGSCKIMYKRIGYFLIVASMMVLFVFAASYQVNDPDYKLLLGGLVIIFIGVFMVIKNRRASEKADRFRMLRRMRSRKK
jgi:hypothetical protein